MPAPANALINAPLGTVNYNGHAFNGSTSSKVKAKVVPDRAGRTTAYTEFQLTLREVIIPGGTPQNPDPTTDNAFTNLRQQLTAQGQRLQFTAQGLGSFDIGPGGAVPDIAYGPMPAIIEAIPYGAGQAWQIEWTCMTRVPLCPGATYQGKPLQHVYELEVRRDEAGYSTRTITGLLEIPANRVAGGRTISDDADSYWDAVYTSIDPIPGFKRSFTRKLSEDKRSLQYQVIDREDHPTAFLQDCTNWDAEQEIDIEYGNKGFARISAWYDVARDKPKVVALQRFLELVASRVQAGLAFLQGPFIPTHFIVKDHITSRRVSLSLAYPVRATDPTTLLAAAGYFAPVPNSDFNGWQASVALQQSSRG